MIIEKAMSDDYLSNTWLVGDRAGGHAVLIDPGAPSGTILEAIERHRLTLTHVLCTHHHVDHVRYGGDYTGRFGCPICGHAAERGMFDTLDHELSDGDEIRSGELNVRAIHVPGHTVGQLAFLIDERRVFTGDTLFRRTVGGTRAPGHATFDDLKQSIMDVLMRLPKPTVVHPGHTDPTTIGEEWESNPFIRLWRGVDDVNEQPCLAFGRPAALLLRAEDYDGGTKCWVRFEDGGTLDVVPGSQVVTRAR